MLPVPLAVMHLTREERIPFVPGLPCLPCLSTAGLLGPEELHGCSHYPKKWKRRATRAAPCKPSPSITPKAPASPKQPLTQILRMCCWTFLPWVSQLIGISLCSSAHKPHRSVTKCPPTPAVNRRPKPGWSASEAASQLKGRQSWSFTQT